MILLHLAALALQAAVFADLFLQRLTWRTTSGLLALSMALLAVYGFVEGWHGWAAVAAAVSAWLAHQWWTGGGGDGTRRRLRRLRRRFTGVRRTAPQTA